MLRKWLRAKEEEITLRTEQNPKVLWTKSFLHAHSISEMNVCMGSVGIISWLVSLPTEFHLIQQKPLSVG